MKESEILGSSDVAKRIIAVREMLENTPTLPIELRGKILKVEHLVIPAVSEEGKRSTAIFLHPGGGTHLGPCFEHLLYRDRTIITISPIGYGRSADPPNYIWNDLYHEVAVSLQILCALDMEKVILHGHSNAAPIILKLALKAHNTRINVEGIELVNPIGLRNCSMFWPIMAFPISGGLTRILSIFRKHPWKLLKSAYPETKHPNSWGKIRYELRKSSKAEVPRLLQEMKKRELRIPIRVVQAYFDWGRIHMPWTASNKEILQQNIPEDLLQIEWMFGLHNVTLGPVSKKLAEILSRFYSVSLPLFTILLPFIPALFDQRWARVLA